MDVYMKGFGERSPHGNAVWQYVPVMEFQVRGYKIISTKE